MGINWKELWCSSNTDMLIAELGTGIGKVPSCVAGDKADNREKCSSSSPLLESN